MKLEVKLLPETKEKLEKLKLNPTTTDEQISLVEPDLKTFGYPYEKCYLGMIVFRTFRDELDELQE